MQSHFRNELFINAIDLSPYIVGVSETGNVIGIKAPPELIHDMFLELCVGESKAIIYYNGNLMRWESLNRDMLRGWVQIERKVKNAGSDPLWFWIRIDE